MIQKTFKILIFFKLGYSGADMKNLCNEAAFGPVRSAPNILDINVEDVRPIQVEDFESALYQGSII